VVLDQGDGTMAYAFIREKLERGGVVILDGGTGTELERRGVPMDGKAWCGPATLEHLAVLEAVHRDYIAAGADIVTSNTFASSPLMLDHAGVGDRFEEINRAAVRAAHRARQASGRADVAVAGSLSHMMPVLAGTDRTDPAPSATAADMAQAFGRQAALLAEEGCDLILLEMMYHPERMVPAFEAALATGLPVWAGFSARRGDDGRVLSFLRDRDIPFEEVVRILAEVEVAAAGVMHTEAGLVADALAILRTVFPGPLVAYPNSGYFKMPNWQFDAVMPADALRQFADAWVASGVQAVGGCCGLSPAHIQAIADLKHAGPARR
jgi:homocysteine S-methyltransferase